MPSARTTALAAAHPWAKAVAPPAVAAAEMASADPATAGPVLGPASAAASVAASAAASAVAAHPLASRPQRRSRPRQSRPSRPAARPSLAATEGRRPMRSSAAAGVLRRRRRHTGPEGSWRSPPNGSSGCRSCENRAHAPLEMKTTT
eukprot:3282852-Pleurochrysis_carterae.AAC.2